MCFFVSRVNTTTDIISASRAASPLRNLLVKLQSARKKMVGSLNWSESLTDNTSEKRPQLYHSKKKGRDEKSQER